MSPSAATDFRNRIEQLGDLPTLPHVVQKLASMIGRPNVSAEEIDRKSTRLNSSH